MCPQSQPRSFLPPLASSDDSAPDLASASSITLVIHGVGNATSDSLLHAAAEGYSRSGLGGAWRRISLSACPTISGRTTGEAESIVLQTSGGAHFVVALPWADRRHRLSEIARVTATVLLVVSALMTVT